MKTSSLLLLLRTEFHDAAHGRMDERIRRDLEGRRIQNDETVNRNDPVTTNRYPSRKAGSK